MGFIPGGPGNDTLNGTAVNDTIEAAGGNDTVYAGLGDDLVNGNDGNDYLEGGGGKDILYGSDKDDTLYGGSEDDRLVGGSGTDQLYGQDGNDVLIGDYLDYLDGGINNDVLFYGKTMVGGDGNDTYYISNGNELIIEDIGKGFDSVVIQSLSNPSLGYTLLPGAEIESIILEDTLGSISVTGNDYYNIIDGNVGNNTIDGKGGNDVIYGFGGNDKLIGGLGDNNLNGGEGFDTLIGGNGNDFLTGESGADTLTGSKGSDVFYFFAPNEGVDTIKDFSVKDDTIYVSSFMFGNLPSGKRISKDQFVLGTSAKDGNDRIIYNKNTGGLFFDVDGKGGIGQMQFAQMSTGLAMTNADIFIA